MQRNRPENACFKNNVSRNYILNSKISLKELVFSGVTGWGPVTLPKIIFFTSFLKHFCHISSSPYKYV